ATSLTLMPQLRTRGARGRVLAWSYVVAALAAGIAVVSRPMLSNIGNTPTAVVLGMAALVWPVWLSAGGPCLLPSPGLGPADSGRVLVASLLTTAIACATYAAAALSRAGQTVGVDLPPRVLSGAMGASLVLDLFVFMALFLAVLTAARLPRLAGMPSSAEYWL